ncbi:MAG: DUF3971 domain-containing protein [Alphaproteobacteria bacterium]|nr:DUF3971 domain-containing protein [Alphaproteobacteria bacterium]
MVGRQLKSKRGAGAHPDAGRGQGARRVRGNGAQSTPADGVRSPLWRRVLVGLLSMVVLPLCLLLALAGGIGYFRLLQGPVSVNFLVDPVKVGINSGLSGLTADFDDVIVTLAEDGGLELRLRNLELSDPGVGAVVSAPQAAIGLSHSSLWSLQASPERVELIEPRVSLVYERDSGFSLTFARPTGRSTAAQGAAPAGQLGSGAAPGRLPGRPKGVFNLSKLFADGSKGDKKPAATSASGLREVGLRNATVVLEAEGNRSIWQVPRLLVDFERRKQGNIVSGSVRVSSSGRIWSATFRAEDEPAGDAVGLTTSIRDLVPQEIAKAVPGIGGLEFLDAPTSADIRARFTRGGEILGAEVSVEVAGSRVSLPEMDGPLLALDEGVLNFAYVPAEQKLTLKSSLVRSGETALFLSGDAVGRPASDGLQNWDFEMHVSPDLVKEAGAEAGRGGVEGGVVRGRADLRRGLIHVDDGKFALAGGTILVNGEIDFTSSPGSKIDGTFSGMPAPRLAALWPSGVAAAGREWFQANLRDGQVRAGKIAYRSGRHLEPRVSKASTGDTQFVVTLQAADVLFDPVPGMPPLMAPRALARFENDALEVTMPDGAMDMGGGDVVSVKQGQFVGTDLLGSGASGAVTFNFTSPAGALQKLLATKPLAGAVDDGAEPENVTGKLAGEVKIGFPLVADLKTSDVGYEITARLKEGQIPDVFDGNAIKGASLDFEVTPQAINAKGDVLIKGVAAKLNLQRIKGLDVARQPPIRLTARLDEADRKQLGIDAGGLVSGEVPVVLTVSETGPEDRRKVHVRADLTPAEVSLAMIGWSKPAGREAFLDFDVEASGDSGAKSLSKLQITGSDIAVAGSVGLDAKGRVTRFDFPQFSLNLVSRLTAKGLVGKDKIWKLKLGGTTYDGRAFFRSLFAVGNGGVKAGGSKTPGGDFDVEVNIDNVLGFEDVSLRGVSAKLSSRDGKLTSLKGQGGLDGGKPMAFELRGLAERGRTKRLLLVETVDAGQAFKLIGLYSNMEGGRLRLEVDLDGSGAAEKIGTLWIDNFRILGDPVVSEVVGITDESVPAIARKKVSRQVIDFDQLRAPFSVGHGQVALRDASVRGALLGATLRGNADFGNNTVDVGGTYVLLQGLNNAFGGIPFFGELLSGPRKEGLFGTNFAIRGSMKKPQVYVHPLSSIAPGIFREIFPMAPGSQSVSPRGEAVGKEVREGRSRASSSPPSVGTSGGPGRTIEGWSSETKRQ